jgi:hypothetical protein
MEAMGKLAEESLKSGEMIETGGLGPTATGSRVRLAGGKITVTDGPFTEAKEVFGGYAVFELKSKEEAVERTRRFMELHHKHWPGWEGRDRGPPDVLHAAAACRALTSCQRGRPRMMGN